ncbi:MAG: AraC family transcriptional regulator [Bacteroidales bacterium]
MKQKRMCNLAERILNPIRQCVRGWLLTNPILFIKKDAAYPDNPQDIVGRVNEFMVQYEYYRNPDLTIEKLCRETNTNRSYLSRSIKRMYGTHFCDWVNLYRIEAAKKMLSEQKSNKIDLEHLAEACGFNSVRSFSRVFKARELCTPRQYYYLEQSKDYYTKNL